MTNSNIQHYDTESIAIYMMTTERYYTASTLARKINLPISYVTGKIYNIEKGKKYYTTIKFVRSKHIKVNAIRGAFNQHGVIAKQLNSIFLLILTLGAINHK